MQIKTTWAADFYLPYFPLEAPHVRELAAKGLAQRGRELRRSKRLRLAWEAGVPDFLASKVCAGSASFDLVCVYV